MLIDSKRTALIVIDMQERLVPAMHEVQPVIDNTVALMRAAARLGIPTIVTEQYPKGLGHTIEPLADLLPNEGVIEKVEFSAASNEEFNRHLAALDRPDTVICGIEAHVCVLQTALQLAERPGQVALVTDATTSRQPGSAYIAFARAGRRNVEMVTTEMVLFEWLGRAGTGEFREISKLIK